MMEKVERESGVRYKNVIKTRMDLAINVPLHISSFDMNENVLAVHAWEDFIAFSNRKSMETYYNLIYSYGSYT